MPCFISPSMSTIWATYLRGGTLRGERNKEKCLVFSRVITRSQPSETGTISSARFRPHEANLHRCAHPSSKVCHLPLREPRPKRNPPTLVDDDFDSTGGLVPGSNPLRWVGQTLSCLLFSPGGTIGEIARKPTQLLTRDVCFDVIMSMELMWDVRPTPAIHRRLTSLGGSKPLTHRQGRSAGRN